MFAPRRSLVWLAILLSLCLCPPTFSRVLFRPSDGVSIRDTESLSSDSRANNIFVKPPRSQTTANNSNLPAEHAFPIFTLNNLFRRAGKQPPPATDAELASSAAKGCSLLYMLAANADDALTRMKTNPKLSKLQSSQSKWDNAGALKQYGWTEKKDPVNWAFMGVNDVMKELGGDTASKENVNVQLMQETAVEVDGEKFVVS